ncbi:histamine H3 receptor [Onychostruthus taczanowskii]|uniref:histamine H3 receptor n=1 Tax=Onychostruthus taczanowskii TaxID=356909 RepID=UPI001B80CB67|nr:histamine H3 receptor [Onychostruthus taczanowskii]
MPHPQRSHPRLHERTVTSSVGMRQQPSLSHPRGDRLGDTAVSPACQAAAGSLCAQLGDASPALSAVPALGTVRDGMRLTPAEGILWSSRPRQDSGCGSLFEEEFGAFCIPLYVPYVLTGRWIFGRSLCKLWLVVDYLLCTSSVFNIVLISYDRFLSVTRAVAYRAQQGNTRQAVLKMVMVWVLAFLLYGPAIISWEYISGQSIIPSGECYAEFFYNWYFLMTASTLEFFTPFISVMFFNLSIYLNIQKRTKMRLDVFHEVHNQSFTEEVERSPEAKLSLKCCKWEQKESAETLDLSKSKAQAAASTSSLDAKDLLETESSREPKCCNKKSCKTSASTLSSDKRVKIVSQSTTQRFRLSRDKKVAKSLAIIVGIFGICWAPYTLLMIIRAGCHGQCISEFWYETSFWLLWINSAVNPVLYPLCHSSFRRAFIKLLCPKKLKIQPHYALQNY